MIDVAVSHLDAIEAQLRLALAQVGGFRHYLATKAPIAPVEVLERCVAHDPRKCLERGDEGAPCGQSVMCRACGHVKDGM